MFDDDDEEVADTKQQQTLAAAPSVVPPPHNDEDDDDTEIVTPRHNRRATTQKPHKRKESNNNNNNDQSKTTRKKPRKNTSKKSSSTDEDDIQAATLTHYPAEVRDELSSFFDEYGWPTRLTEHPLSVADMIAWGFCVIPPDPAETEDVIGVCKHISHDIITPALFQNRVHIDSDKSFTFLWLTSNSVQKDTHISPEWPPRPATTSHKANGKGQKGRAPRQNKTKVFQAKSGQLNWFGSRQILKLALAPSHIERTRQMYQIMHVILPKNMSSRKLALERDGMPCVYYLPRGITIKYGKLSEDDAEGLSELLQKLIPAPKPTIQTINNNINNHHPTPITAVERIVGSEDDDEDMEMLRPRRKLDAPSQPIQSPPPASQQQSTNKAQPKPTQQPTPSKLRTSAAALQKQSRPGVKTGPFLTSNDLFQYYEEQKADMQNSSRDRSKTYVMYDIASTINSYIQLKHDSYESKKNTNGDHFVVTATHHYLVLLGGLWNRVNGADPLSGENPTKDWQEHINFTAKNNQIRPHHYLRANLFVYMVTKLLHSPDETYETALLSRIEAITELVTIDPKIESQPTLLQSIREIAHMLKVNGVNLPQTPLVMQEYPINVAPGSRVYWLNTLMYGCMAHSECGLNMRLHTDLGKALVSHTEIWKQIRKQRCGEVRELDTLLYHDESDWDPSIREFKLATSNSTMPRQAAIAKYLIKNAVLSMNAIEIDFLQSPLSQSFRERYAIRQWSDINPMQQACLMLNPTDTTQIVTWSSAFNAYEQGMFESAYLRMKEATLVTQSLLESAYPGLITLNSELQFPINRLDGTARTGDTSNTPLSPLTPSTPFSLPSPTTESDGACAETPTAAYTPLMSIFDDDDDDTNGGDSTALTPAVTSGGTFIESMFNNYIQQDHPWTHIP